MLKSRPACCATAGFAAVSFAGYFIFADTDPSIAGTVKLAAAALFIISGAVFTVFGLYAAYPKQIYNNSGAGVSQPKPKIYAKADKRAAGKQRLYASIAMLLFSCGAAALLSQSHFGKPARLLEKYSGFPQTVTFTTLDIERISAYDASYYVEITKIGGSSAGRIRAILEADYILDLDLHKIYTLEGIICSSPEYSALSEAAYSASKGIMLNLHSETDEGKSPVPLRDDALLRRYFKNINSRMSQRLIIGLGKNAGGFTSCLLLGRWDKLSGTVSRDFRTLGILHLLAISGEHLSILLGALDMLLRGLNKNLRFLLLSAGALFIFAVTGMSPSVARAAFMSVLYYGSFILRRRSDGPTSLFSATAFIIAISPAAAADIGLLMSVCSAFGIITLGKRFAQSTKLNRGALYFLSCNFINSLYATIFTMPVSWLVTGELAPLSPISTLIFTLPFTALLYITPLAIFLYGTPLFRPVGASVRAISTFLVGLSEKLAWPLSNAVVSLRYPFVWIAFAAAAMVLIFMPKLKPSVSQSIKVIAAVLVFCVMFGIALGAHSLTSVGSSRIIYYNKGKNDMLVLGTRGASLICDISDGTYTPLKSAARLARSKLYAVNIDGYMLTHLHRRHVMQFARLASRYFVKTLVLPTPQTEAERSVAGALESAAHEYGSEVLYYDASINSQTKMGGLTLTLPARVYTKRSTHPVIAMHITGQGADLLYLGGGNITDDRVRQALICGWSGSAKCIIFGAHSPSYYSLNDFGYPVSAELYIYSSASVRNAYDIDHFPDARILTLDETDYSCIELIFNGLG